MPEVGVGTAIMHYLRSKNIYPTQGCSCYEVAADMDKVPAESIQENIEHWTDRMKESVKDWRQHADKMWKKFVCPPRFVIKDLILWACEQSINSRSA